MIATVLMVCSAGIIAALGIVHLIYTFRGPKLTPRDPALQVSMRQTPLVLTRQTTVWRAWIGFNASHSMGAILFGLIYGFLAIAHGQLLFQSPFLLGVGLIMLGGLCTLARIYWFKIPFTGISIALACYVASIAASQI